MKTIILQLCIVLAPAVSFAQNPNYQASSPDSQAATEEANKRVQSDAVAALEERLWDPNTDVRQAAVYALEAMGPGAKSAIAVIAQRMRDPDAYIRADAARTLVEFGPDAVPSLLPLLRDSNPRVRELTTRTLEEIEFNVASGMPTGLH
jgi:HEAT repeat protein